MFIVGEKLWASFFQIFKLFQNSAKNRWASFFQLFQHSAKNRWASIVQLFQHSARNRLGTNILFKMLDKFEKMMPNDSLQNVAKVGKLEKLDK